MHRSGSLIFSDSAPPRRNRQPRLPVGKPETRHPNLDAVQSSVRDKPREFLHVRKVATILDVSPKWVYHMIGSGELVTIRLGPRQTRVLKASLEAYIDMRLREEAEREV